MPCAASASCPGEVLALNGMITFAAPPIGCHHLIDGVASIIVAGMAIFAIGLFDKQGGWDGHSQTA